MSQGDLFNVRFLGRPFKPVALGLSFYMLVLMVVNINDTGRLGVGWPGDLVAVLAGAAILCLWSGWWLRSQILAEVGLLATGAAYLLRALFLTFTIFPDQSIFFSLAACEIAWGAYLLERMDPHRLDPPVGTQ